MLLLLSIFVLHINYPWGVVGLRNVKKNSAIIPAGKIMGVMFCVHLLWLKYFLVQVKFVKSFKVSHSWYKHFAREKEMPVCSVRIKL